MAISFDGANRLIVLSSGTITLGVRDLWSRWVDWLQVGDNSKWQLAMCSVGGDDIDTSAGTRIPVYTYLTNGWKIRPQSADHTLEVVDGILLVDGGGDPFVSPVGDFTVRIAYKQPVQAITVVTDGVSGPSADEIWNGIAIEAGMSPADMLRIILAAVSGRNDGIGTDTERYYSRDGSKPRITATFDTQGNRTAVAVDGS